ncbi:MAG: hypothetical protein NT159_12815 [Proteobacteria bacterium]|nr:hypothetical protein [Pseudomonadota bacterium]
MSVISVGLTQGTGSSDWRSTVRQADQDFDQLYQSLQSGNLSAAQQAYTDFQKIQSGLTSPTTTPAGGSAATTMPNAVTSDWSALGVALQSGDLPSAQGALGKLQQDAQLAWQSHLQQEAQTAQSVYALMQGVQATTSGAIAASSQPTTGSVQDDLNALNQALQSGDSTGAQKLLAQLEQDLQASGQASGSYGGHRHHHHHHGGSFGMSTVPPNAVPPVAAVTSPASGSTVATNNSGTSGKAST